MYSECLSYLEIELIDFFPVYISLISFSCLAAPAHVLSTHSIKKECG